MPKPSGPPPLRTLEGLQQLELVLEQVLRLRVRLLQFAEREGGREVLHELGEVVREERHAAQPDLEGGGGYGQQWVTVTLAQNLPTGRLGRVPRSH